MPTATQEVESRIPYTGVENASSSSTEHPPFDYHPDVQTMNKAIDALTIPSEDSSRYSHPFHFPYSNDYMQEVVDTWGDKSYEELQRRYTLHQNEYGTSIRVTKLSDLPSEDRESYKWTIEFARPLFEGQNPRELNSPFTMHISNIATNHYRQETDQFKRKQVSINRGLGFYNAEKRAIPLAQEVPVFVA